MSGSGGGSGVGFGTNRASLNLAGGANNNLNPHPTAPAWPTLYGRVILTSTSGAANVTGMVAGVDGQPVLIMNDDNANNITLNSLNAGSLAANRFQFAADVLLTPGASVMVMYDSTLAKWLLT